MLILFQFDSEDIVGAWVKQNPEKRKDVFLASKFGLTFAKGEMKERSDPEYIFGCCEKSLKRMNVKTIDLYYCHRVDRKVPVEKIVGAMVELKRYGICPNFPSFTHSVPF
jgi:aryl-alcohol dehydrogenase-like predicted oxidoreductase